ncbi:MAG TPA: type I polyketide synthase, partial [Thermoanaerobaculia bacterium]|nr:type I polyketide synthase [Thermoanaerobaculia bacterium]
AGWGVNQDGKTNGITAPNPESQTRLEQYVYDKYGIDPADIQLIEAHGTGTKLGDPIEIDGLKKAFAKYTDREQYCAVGSVKSNIGHTLTAAGIAGVIKVLLALRAQNLPPTIHFERLNEHIDLAGSPFYVNDRLREWPVRGGARRQAAVSSFGFSGTNAHLVIAEAPEGKRTRTEIQPGARHIVPLSARTEKQLRQKGRELLEFLRVQDPRPEIADVAYTLQVGREALEERVGFIVASVDELVERLASWLDGRSGTDVRQGRIRDGRESLQLLSEDDEARETLVGKWIAQRKLPKLLGLWVKGLDLDWSLLYRDSKPRRIRLPLYPFAKERYWIEAAPQASSSSPPLHPLLHVNTSDFQRQSYRATLSGQEFFLTDHQVRTGVSAAQKILPGMAYLEMARAAISHASAAQSPAVLELRDTVWTKPLVVGGETQLDIVVSPVDEERVEYEIFSGEGEEEVVHCHGRAVWRHDPAPERLDLAQLEAEMVDGRLEAGDIYAACAAMGLYYGPAFQAVTVIHRGKDQALARLRLPSVVAGTADDFVLHPSLLDSAVQSVLGVIGDLSALSRKPRLPFALESLRVLSPCAADMAVWVRIASGSQRDDGIVRLDLDLCDAEGRVCAQMRGLSLRVLEAAARHLLAKPVWQPGALVTGAAHDSSEHQIILCGLPSIDVPQAVVHTLSAGAEMDIARRYVDHAAACFARIRALLEQRPTGRVLLQCVTDEESLAGLSGLLRTATLENPHVRTQLIVVPQRISAGDLGRTLRDEKDHGPDPLVRYERGVRQIVQWQEIEPAPEPPLAYKDDGVYLITGGLGAIGRLFATDILDSTQRARIVVTGRAELSAAKQSAIATL